MRLEVEAGGRKRAVEITGADRVYRAVVDGRAYAVDVARVGDIWSLLVGSAEPVLSSPALIPKKYHPSYFRNTNQFLELVAYIR